MYLGYHTALVLSVLYREAVRLRTSLGPHRCSLILSLAGAITLLWARWLLCFTGFSTAPFALHAAAACSFALAPVCLTGFAAMLVTGLQLLLILVVFTRTCVISSNNEMRTAIVLSNN